MSPTLRARFADAYTAGLPRVVFLNELKKISFWIDLSTGDALDRLKREPPTSAAQFAQGLNVVAIKTWRDFGLSPDATGYARFQQISAEVAHGRGSEAERQLVARNTTSLELGKALFAIDPNADQPRIAHGPEDEELQRRSAALFERLKAIAPATSPGTTTSALIEDLHGIVEEAAQLATRALSDSNLRPYLFHSLGHAALTLARTAVLAGRVEPARIHFEKAALAFIQAHRPDDAESCRQQAHAFELSLSGRLDDAAMGPLRALTSNAQTPVRRIGSLIDLSNVAWNAADTFESLQHATSAAAQLAQLNYSDPESVGVDDAITQWTEAAIHSGAVGSSLLQRIIQVGLWYLTILRARFAVRNARSRAEGDVVHSVLARLQEALVAFGREAEAIGADHERALAAYFPTHPNSAPLLPSLTNASDPDRANRQSIDSALQSIRDRCNERLETGAAMDDLLAALNEILGAVQSGHDALMTTKAFLARAYVLMHLGRAPELLTASRDARQSLLAGRKPSLESFSHFFERALYLESLERELSAFVIQQDSPSVLQHCQSVVRDFELQRYRVSSPYRQSSLLSGVVNFYRMGALAALKLKRWDDMLEMVELVKARSALRTRLLQDFAQPGAPGEESGLNDAFNKATEALRMDETNLDLVAHRQHLWDLLSIVRSRQDGATTLASFSLVALQKSLSDDEVLIGFFWLDSSTLLYSAVDRLRFEADRIVLSPEHATYVADFVTFVQELKGSYGPAMDQAVRKVGRLLLPAALRSFISAKKRLILSPHRSLHLYPFHAAQWDESDVVGTRFAVRYVPNFSSLLLPWCGHNNGSLLAIGIGEFADAAVPLLEEIETDIPYIAELHRISGTHVETLTGSEATHKHFDDLKAGGSLSRFRSLHFGTHGLSVFATPNQPLDAQLLLHDGGLDAMEIAGLRLNAELVVLSACHSGQRALAMRNLTELPGDDIFGFQSAFFQAGARCVLGTLWLVETTSSSKIIRAFHRHSARGQTSDVALHHALKDYLADPSSKKGVYYWAPYFVSCLGADSSLLVRS